MPEPRNKMTKKNKKKQVDRKTRLRKRQEGEKGLSLSSNKGTPLGERFQGPYTVAHKTDSINYEINAPERRKKTQVCHVNNFENKLAHLEKNSKHAEEEELDKRNKDLFSNIYRRTISARRPLKAFEIIKREREREREERERRREREEREKERGRERKREREIEREEREREIEREREREREEGEREKERERKREGEREKERERERERVRERERERKRERERVREREREKREREREREERREREKEKERERERSKRY